MEHSQKVHMMPRFVLLHVSQMTLLYGNNVIDVPLAYVQLVKLLWLFAMAMDTAKIGGQFGGF